MGSAKILDMVKEWGPLIAPYLKDLKKKGEEGVKYIEALVKTNSLNGQIIKKNKLIDDYFKEIGKKIYEEKISINNIEIKDNIERINNRKNEIKEIEEEIQKINLNIKNNKLFDDLPNVSNVVSDIERAQGIIKSNQTKSKTSKNKKVVKSKSK